MKTQQSNVALHIVVADDDPEDHDLIKKALKNCDVNYHVTQTFSGRELMNLLYKKDSFNTTTTRLPDMIIMDLKMEDMDGFDALKKLQEDPALRNIPVHILTESNSDDDKKRAMNLGAKGFYSKPYNYNELESLMENICEEAKKKLGDCEE